MSGKDLMYYFLTFVVGIGVFIFLLVFAEMFRVEMGD